MVMGLAVLVDMGQLLAVDRRYDVTSRYVRAGSSWR